MSKNLEVFFSNSLEVLYQRLKNSLFESTTFPFMRRLVVVYGPAMKTWLMLRMAEDPELDVAFGIEVVYLHQCFETLLRLSCGQHHYFPSLLELTFAIEKELMEVVYHFNELSLSEQKDWEVFIHYLKLNRHHLGPKICLSRKMEKRLIGLSQHVARLFQDYGRYASTMVSKWETSASFGWQGRLWGKLFSKETGWSYPVRALQEAQNPSSSFSLHFFSISFLTASEFHFLNRLSKHVPVNYYLLSPCAVFWSDIRSDRENVYLQAYLQKKLGVSPSKMLQLEEFLRDRNPLLANFGRLGREMAYQIEESHAVAHACYLLPQHVQALNEDLFMHEDLYLQETAAPLSLLHAVQADLLMMRNPHEAPPFNLKEESGSIQLHAAPSQRREVEILYHNLLKLIAKEPSLSPGDMIVMAPQIGDYVPYIQSIFGRDSSQLDFQILDLGMQTQSKIVQGFLQLLKLSESRWESSQLLQLFEHSSFQRRHQFSLSDYATIHKWIEQSGIRWGEDGWHRNEVLERRHCEQGMVEETLVGTWDYGLTRLLLGLTTVIDEKTSTAMDTLPCSTIDFSQGELLGKWIHLLHSLRDDLSPLHDRSQMTIEDWVNFMVCLLENYFQPDFEDPYSVEEYEDLKAQFEVLRNSARFFKETLFSFTSIKTHLLSLLKQQGLTYREDRLQSVRFCSLVPLRSIPAKVIAILGLQEEAFPRVSHHSSLNLMMEKEDSDYCPSSTDYDRYLFLEALHSAQDYLLLSYQRYSRKDNRELQPSLIIEELFSYLDKFYRIGDEKISQKCIVKHPFDSFDERYFAENKKDLSNFSEEDFRAAKMNGQTYKFSPYRFINNFIYEDHPSSHLIKDHTKIDIKHLTAVARNPIKFHLNQTLEIYLKTEEDRSLQTEEELMISVLDKYWLKQSALNQPIEKVLYQAEREGKLPFGLFKAVAVDRFKEEVKEIHERLQKHSVNPAEIFQIEFCTSCSQPTQLRDGLWLLPAISLIYEDGYQLSIVGKLPYVTKKGLIALNRGALSDVWKIWPQFLMYCYAVQWFPEKFEQQLISVHAQIKKSFFEKPDGYLKQFVNYYARCLQNFSPLFPEWIPYILESDANGLQDEMRKIFSESFGGYQSVDLRWILNKNHLLNAETLIQDWKPQAEVLLGDLIRFWYPSS